MSASEKHLSSEYYARKKAEAQVAALIAETQTLRGELARALRVLGPFSAMAEVMERRAAMTFGKHIKDADVFCESSGELGLGILTMGHFRDALALVPDAPGWGGQYKPAVERQALADLEPQQPARREG